MKDMKNMEEMKPYKVVESSWHKWFCEGPFQSGNQWNTEQEAQKECDTLNEVFNAGYQTNPDTRKITELQRDIAHAWQQAKEWVPDYPFDFSIQTASQAVWICGTAYKGASDSCGDWRKLFKHLAKEQYDALIKLCADDPKAYDELMSQIQK